MSDLPEVMLRRLGLKPKHSWGQNFLGDAHTLERITDEAMIVAGDVVLELGAGLGHLTRHLLSTGARVTAVERDRDMVSALEKQALEGLTVVAENAAAIDFAATAKADQVIVVGNLPYHLSSAILFKVLEQADRVPRALFTLQREVVDRIAAPPGSRTYGLLSVLLGLRYHLEKCFDVPAELFSPPPKVDSAVLRLSRRETPAAQTVDEVRFRRVVKAGFAQRRKTVLNSLKSDRKLFAAYDVPAALALAQVEPTRRAETMSVVEFAALERALGPVVDDGGAPEPEDTADE